MSTGDPLLRLLARLGQEGADYVLVGGQAVRLNGFVRATEDIDLLVRPGRDNGERIKRALGFLPTAAELDPASNSASGAAPFARRRAYAPCGPAAHRRSAHPAAPSKSSSSTPSPTWSPGA